MCKHIFGYSYSTVYTSDCSDCSVLQSWEEFDEDKHCTGAFLKWPEKATEITTAITFQNPDLLTESETSEMSDTINLIVVKKSTTN